MWTWVVPKTNKKTHFFQENYVFLNTLKKIFLKKIFEFFKKVSSHKKIILLVKTMIDFDSSVPPKPIKMKSSPNKTTIDIEELSGTTTPESIEDEIHNAVELPQNFPEDSSLSDNFEVRISSGDTTTSTGSCEEPSFLTRIYGRVLGANITIINDTNCYAEFHIHKQSRAELESIEAKVSGGSLKVNRSNQGPQFIPLAKKQRTTVRSRRTVYIDVDLIVPREVDGKIIYYKCPIRANKDVPIGSIYKISNAHFD